MAPVDVLPLGGEADGSGKRWKTRKGFSGLVLPHQEPEELNGLTKAFLGDPEAQGRLCWDEPLPLELCGKAPQYDWVEAEPNANQLKAIQTALTQLISFIQGPPGTGKTKMILNLASCIAHQKNPDGSPQTVAIVSQNNAAIENVEDRIKTYKNGTPARPKMGMGTVCAAGKRGKEAGVHSAQSRRAGGTGTPYCCPFYPEITHALVLDYVEVQWKKPPEPRLTAEADIHRQKAPYRLGN